MTGRLAVAGASLLLLATAPAAALEIGGELTLGYDDNLANVRDGGHRFEGGFSLARLQAQQVLPLSAHSALLLQLSGQAQSHFDYQGLTHLRTQLLARYLLRPGRAFYVPTLGLSASIAGLAYDSDLRDATEYRALFYVDQPLTTQLSLRLGGAGRWRRHSDAALFDDSTTQFGIDLDWQPLATLSVYGGYQWRGGDFVAVGLPGPPVLAAAAAAGPDDVFEGLTAFRQDGDGTIAHLGLNYSFSRQLSLDVQAQRADMESDFGVRYRRVISIASLLFRY